MANPCAGLDPTWAHHLPPSQAAAGHYCHSASSWPFLPLPATAFENQALACALRAAMSPAPAAANAKAASSSYLTTPSSSSTSSASELLSGGGGHDAPAPAPGSSSRTPVVPSARRRAALNTGPRAAAGRVTKRKPRPSRRPPPTYIVADPANFRRMVQEVTGRGFLPGVASSTGGVRLHQLPSTAAAAPAGWLTPPACALPTLDTSAFLFDREAVATPPGPARGSDDRNSSGGASAASVAAAVGDGGDDSSVMRELEAMACVSDFPTLESWGFI